MKVVILCGGKGMRLLEETEYRPKPLVGIGGYPILWHIMKLYAHFGFQEFVLCLGYKGHRIKEYFLNYEAMNNPFTISLGKKSEIVYHGEHKEQDFQVTLVPTGNDTMTGARVKKVERYLDGDTFMVTYGDGLSDVNIEELLKFHQSHGKLATVTTVRPTSRFGIVEIDADGRISRFSEKPQVDGWVSAGFFVFQKKALKNLSEDPGCILEREFLERLSREGQIMAFRHQGFFFAMAVQDSCRYSYSWWARASGCCCETKRLGSCHLFAFWRASSLPCSLRFQSL